MAMRTSRPPITDPDRPMPPTNWQGLNREAWLAEALHGGRFVEPKRSIAARIKQAAGVDVPVHTAVTVGWMANKRISTSGVVRATTIGMCWRADALPSRRPEVFILPALSDPVSVLGVLTHEALHAALPNAGHGPAYRAASVKVGMEGIPTANRPGKDLALWLEDLAGILGEYPHRAMPIPRPGDYSRYVPMICSRARCGCLLRITRKWLTDVGAPRCGCGAPMVVKRTSREAMQLDMHVHEDDE